MIIAYLNKTSLVSSVINEENVNLLHEAVWVDLISPTKEEEQQVEKALGLNIPTWEEMREIEVSSRLYKDDGNLFMTATMIAKSNSIAPDLQPITFVLTQKQLITLRYVELQAFTLFVSQLDKLNSEYNHPIMVFTGLLEASIDRLADILETIGGRLDMVSKNLFHQNVLEKKKVNYENTIQDIGLNADLNTKARESLVNFNRLVSFFAKSIEPNLDKETPRITVIKKDIESLSDYANFISSKVNFLLDATLGMINIEQSTIIKIFSVAAVIFLPPTLIASIYGMNFKFMPELSYKWGYLIALTLMIFSALIPFKYFKYKKWL